MTFENEITRCSGKYTHLIWDFNGTLLDDVRLGMDCVNSMLAVRGLPTLPNLAAYRQVFGFPIEDYYRRLGFDFEKEDYHTVLAPEWVALYLAGEGQCRLNQGVEKTIAGIKMLGILQILLSASNLRQLEGQLERLDLSTTFEEVWGLDNIHARSKRALAEEWMARHPMARPLFVGDTVHDAEVAEAVGADCILFEGGHQSAELLAGKGMAMISRISDLPRYL